MSAPFPEQHPTPQPLGVPAPQLVPRVPARPAETAPAPEPEQASVVDALADDAVATKVEWPAGAPMLWPYLRLPFRIRSQFFRKYRELQNQQGTVRELKALADRVAAGEKGLEDIAGSRAAEIFELYAVMDELMEIAAVDKAEYRIWVDTHEDDEFSQLFGAFMQRSQPGEASSSAG